ncbi:MAG: hypothetical protein JXQ27_07315 [Acidobacteria bacterium]|nr:hypothetical protein [Acidobacteriota bacterium]
MVKMATISILLILFCLDVGYAGEKPTSAEICQYWMSIVDPSIQRPDLHLSWQDEGNILFAIECLFELKGRTGPANFSGATHPAVSDIFDHATVEVAALYFMTYLYYQTPDYVNAVVLVDKNNEFSTEAAIEKAYDLYRKWYQEIEKLGISKAREQGLDPLQDSDVRWY